MKFDPRFVSLEGKKFGWLVVLAYSHNKPKHRGRRHFWKCLCDCGKHSVVDGDKLKYGHTKSCGCQMNRVKSDLSGMRFERLVAIEHVGGSRWKCRCDCGAIRIVESKALKNSMTRSCGCYRRDTVGPKISASLKTHGMSGTPTYGSWSAMIGRCENPNNPKYPSYGGRGIRVCRRWRRSFVSFLRDMGEKPSGHGWSLGRKNNDGNYCRSNCRWENPTQQANNKSSTKLLTFRGSTKTIAQWAKETGIGFGTLWSRIEKHRWSVERALSEVPIRHGSSRLVTCQGKSLTVREWAKITGTNHKTMSSRIHMGWSDEDVVLGRTNRSAS